jgi:two-component system response regulator WspF
MRAAVIHHSAAMADLLAGILRSQPGGTTAWSSGHAEEAIARCGADPPDVVLLHAAIGPPGAVEATRRIVAGTRALVIVITEKQHSDTKVVFEAMGAGAIDVVESPSISASGKLEGVEKLARKLRTAASLAGTSAGPRMAGRETPAPATAVASLPGLVVIGASTGGPSALVTLLGSLPATFAAPIVVVQHVDAQFSSDLAEWLRKHVRLPIVIARRGREPERGTIALTGTNDDLVLTAARQFAFSRPEDGSFYHPSVDAFFESAARHWPAPGVAVLLTGIGRDGAGGMLMLRQKGWHTIAQDKATSVVYGMPRAAAEIGAAVEVLPIDRIAGAVQHALGTRASA